MELARFKAAAAKEKQELEQALISAQVLHCPVPALSWRAAVRRKVARQRRDDVLMLCRPLLCRTDAAGASGGGAAGPAGGGGGRRQGPGRVWHVARPRRQG